MASSARRGAALLARGILSCATASQSGGRHAAMAAGAALESCQPCSTAALRQAWSAVPVALRGFSTSGSVHQGLSDILKAESKHEKESFEKPEQIAGGPPAPWKLTEAPGDTLLTLNRSHNGETISVDLHVNNQPAPAFEADGEAEEEEATSVVFNVAVSKGDKSLVFECESDGNSVTVNHVSLEPKDGFDSESMYTGPVFEELDETLQRQFHSYLEERGITAELGDYLRYLIYDKEQREYLAWLDNVEGFVSKQ